MPMVYPGRRRFLQQALGGAAALHLMPATAQDRADSDGAQAPRLLVVLLRGGMDGLHAVPPVDDADYARLRPSIRIERPLRLDGRFGLHPALAGLHALWEAGQLQIVHTTGFPYAGRSHFEGQDIMQTGLATPYSSPSGWVGRAMETAGLVEGVALSIPMPIIVRGSPAAGTEYPNWMRPVSPVLARDLHAMWQADPALSPYSERLLADAMQRMGPQRNLRGDEFREQRSPAALARLAAQRMSEPDGPRVGLIDVDSGFDTHANQGADTGTHATRLADLDGIVRAWREGMGAHWARSVLVTVTEFGRTAAENGTGGTDHGVGSCCFVAGGLVTSPRVLSAWQGLGKDQLFEGRDLPASIDVRAVYARVVERVFALSPAEIQTRVLAHTAHQALRDLL
ncbi:MAG: DUF1501 domain-containing protein [Rubrivivax sp.]